MPKYDYLFKNARIIDPANHLDDVKDIAISDKLIERVDSDISGQLAKQVIDVTGKVIMPGIIDTHVHAYKHSTKGVGYKMLIKAGVTTAVDFEGPIEGVLQEIVEFGGGLNLATIQGIFPGQGIEKNNASKDEVDKAINLAMEHGAIGTKIIGGHYPLTPETTSHSIHLTVEKGGYVAFHVGTTETGSNIEGLEEAISLADGRPIHLAHINAYTRGIIDDPLIEVKRALDALRKAPNAVSESHLAPYNGCNGTIESNGLPKSHVTRNCLRAKGYEISKSGLQKALIDGHAGVYDLVGNEVKYLFGEKAVNRWLEAGTAVGTCFPVNLRLPALEFAQAKNEMGEFIVDAISSDGGAIPRNFILKYGVPLIKFGALTFSEFVKKVSLTPAKMLGLKNKGHLSAGADADIIVIDPENGDVETVLSGGKVSMAAGVVFDLPGKILTLERGVNYLQQLHIPYEQLELENSLYFLGKGDRK